MITQDDITIVITSHKRLEMLKECYKSVVDNKFKNVVVAISSVDVETQAYLDQLQKENPKLIVSATSEERSNALDWFSGVRAVKTSLSMLLHDDDLLCSDLAPVIDLLNNTPIGFCLWDASQFGDEVKLHKQFSLETNSYESSILLHKLNNQSYSISPCQGLFSTFFLKAALLEFIWEFQDKPEFYTRPNMMIGNDFLLWIRASQCYRYFGYVSEPLTSVRYHDGSETVRNIKAGDGPLIEIYAKVREYCVNKRRF